MTQEEQIQEVYDELNKVYHKYNLINKEITFNCVQKAIKLKEKELELKARLEYLSQLIFLGFYDEAIAYYPWFINYKKNNEMGFFNYYHFVWSFKWIIIRIGNYGKIPLEKINVIFEQFETELRGYDASDKLIEYFNSIVQLSLGNIDKAIESYKNYKKLRKTSSMDDCYACQINNMIDLHIANKDYSKAVFEAKDVVSKKHTCASVPKTTYPKLIFCHLMLDNKLKADEFFQLSLKSLNLKEPQISNIYYALYYISKNKNFVKVKKILDTQLDYALNSNSDVEKFKFYLSCYILLKNMENSEIKNIKLNLNEKIDLPYNEKGYDIIELKNWFKNNYIYHMNTLNNRNGNLYYGEYQNLMEENF